MICNHVVLSCLAKPWSRCWYIVVINTEVINVALHKGWVSSNQEKTLRLKTEEDIQHQDYVTEHVK